VHGAKKLRISGEKENFKFFLLKAGLVAFFALFLLIDQWIDRSLTLNALIEVAFDPRLVFVCLILVPWNKLEKFAQKTGQLRLAQSLALIMIGILTIANIMILVSSGLVLLEYRNAEDQLSQDKTFYGNLEGKYPYIRDMEDFDQEIRERESIVTLFDWVNDIAPEDEPCVLVAPNPSTLDFLMHEIDYEQGIIYSFDILLLWDEEGIPLGFYEWPILISTEVYFDNQLSSLLEQRSIAPFPSQWFNLTEQQDLVVWLDGIDARPLNFAPNQTMLRSPLTWRVMEVEDNGNGVLDVSVSSSSLIIDEDACKVLETEMEEIAQLMRLDESIPGDEEVLEDKAPLLLVGCLLVFMAVPGTAYYSWKTMRAIRDWKAIQRQYWGSLQKKLESLQEGLVLRGNRVNGYPWEDLEHFVDWNKPVAIKITDTKYRLLLGAIYQAAPLETAFIVQEGDLKDRFTKKTGQFAIDFSQPLEMETENQLATFSKDETGVEDIREV
jgi:hypothetical protein